MTDVPKMPRASSEIVDQTWTAWLLDPLTLWAELRDENPDLALELHKLANANATLPDGQIDVEQSASALKLAAFTYGALKRALAEEQE